MKGKGDPLFSSQHFRISINSFFGGEEGELWKKWVIYVLYTIFKHFVRKKSPLNTYTPIEMSVESLILSVV